MRNSTSAGNKKSWGLVAGILVLVLTTIVSLVYVVGVGTQERTAVRKDILRLEQLDAAQIEHMARLCRVWGLVKYYHPALASGRQDWDEHLLALIPKVLAAQNLAETDQLLLAWLEQLGPYKKQPPPDLGSLQVQSVANTTWLSDASLSPELGNALRDLLDTNLNDRKKGPVTMNSYNVPSFANEKPYDNINYEDDGMRLLALFRYWNIIEYYYPYMPIPNASWEDILYEFIPKVILGDELAYKQTFAALASRLQDTHAMLYDTRRVIRGWVGNNILPVKFLILERQVVLTEIAPEYAANSALRAGDIVRSIDGEDIWAVIERKLQYLSCASENRIVKALRYDLFRTSKEQMRLTIERADGTLDVSEQCYTDWYPRDQKASAVEMIGTDVARINPCALEKDQIFKIMESLMDTRGIVIDLRQYPSDFLPISIGSILMPESTPFARLEIPDSSVPGRYLRTEPITTGNTTGNPDRYRGKVMILMNECSLSQSEYTIMALRQAPDATVVGSPSVGSDGDVAEIRLPGGIVTFISSLGIYYPDGTPTQRVGLMPDVWCEPTVAGIRAGRDELLDKAVALIRAV